MRYPEGHKADVRAAIVHAAARALRRSGLAGVSIPALMREVGLTHGGFYAHFDSRDALVAEAVRAAAEQTGASVLSQGDARSAYLSMAHVEHPDEGCVLAALGTEGARQPPPVREAFAEAARGFVRLVDAADREAPSDEALRVAAQMVGAVVLARLVDDPALAERLLRAARG